jgi:predicted SnoaL-like aldol condensation-catalyzing enzyme
MPLYELIMVCRLGESQALANLMKSLVVACYQEGGVVRRFINLGDRVAQRNYKSKDGMDNCVVRYFTAEFDSNPDTRKVMEKIARNNPETVQVFVHKLKDKDYYKRMLNNEKWKMNEFSNTIETNLNEIEEVRAKYLGDGELDSYVKKEINKSQLF